MEQQHRTIRLTLDDAPFRAALGELKGFAAPELALELLEVAPHLANIKCEGVPAPGADSMRVVLQPSERLLELVAASRKAREGDWVVVEKARHEPSIPVDGSTSVHSEPR